VRKFDLLRLAGDGDAKGSEERTISNSPKKTRVIGMDQQEQSTSKHGAIQDLQKRFLLRRWTQSCCGQIMRTRQGHCFARDL